MLLVLAACAGKDTPRSICEDTLEVLESCIASPYGYYYSSYPYSYAYTVTQDVDECAETLEACTEDDLELLDEYLGCLYDTCDSVACAPVLDAVGTDCLPYTYTTSSSSTSAIRAMDVHSSESP